MTTKPVFVCERCESEDCELLFAMIDGHKVPTFWHCNQCGWEGKMRKCMFVEVEAAPSPFTKKTAAEVKAGRTTKATGREKVVVPSVSEAWKETLDRISEEAGIPEELLQPASSWPQGDGAQLHAAETPADVAEELGLAAPEEPEVPDAKSTCPINCPHCGEPLVVVHTQCSGSIQWVWWDYGVGDSEWKWIMVEAWTYSCPTCGEQLDRDDIDEIPDIF